MQLTGSSGRQTDSRLGACTLQHKSSTRTHALLAAMHSRSCVPCRHQCDRSSVPMRILSWTIHHHTHRPALAPEEFAGHGFAEAPGASSDNHVQGLVGRPPDALHAQAIQGCKGHPQNGSHCCGTPAWTHGDACTHSSLSTSLLSPHRTSRWHCRACCTQCCTMQTEGLLHDRQVTGSQD